MRKHKQNNTDEYSSSEIALLRAFKHIINGYSYDEFIDKMRTQHQRRIGFPTWWALLLAFNGYSDVEGDDA